MARGAVDLDWDHSVGENLMPNTDDELEEDLNGITFYNGPLLGESTMDDQDCVKLSRRHLSFLMRSLDEANSLLREQQNLQSASSHRPQPRNTTDTSGSKCKKTCANIFNKLTKYNLLVTLVLQAIMLVIVSILDSTNSTNQNGHTTTVSPPVDTQWQTYFVMAFVCIVNLCLVIYMSVQLTKTLIESKTTTLMLAQAYLSTVTMFAGLYVLTYRIDKGSWTLHSFNTAKDRELIKITYLFLKMLFHSISTSTLCGGSTIHPDAWYNFILMSIQMMLSFLYFTSILRVVISASPPKPPRASPRLRRNPSLASLASRLSTEQSRLVNGGVQPARYGGL